MKLDTSDLQKMKICLIKAAKDNKFKDFDYEIWGNSNYSKDDLKRRKSLNVGYCYEDESDNYIIYSITNDKFYFIGDGGDLDDLHELSLKEIKNIIDEFQDRYF